MNESYALAVHGGAGTIRRDAISAEQEAEYHAGLRRALEVGRAVLAAGGSALDAVTAAVVALEDDPLFNAGRGAVFTSAGTQEMDAAVMDGRDRRAGAVAAHLRAEEPGSGGARRYGALSPRSDGRGRRAGISAANTDPVSPIPNISRRRARWSGAAGDAGAARARSSRRPGR